MRKDINAINEAFRAIQKEQSENTDMEANTKPSDVSKQYEKTFYNTWEDVIDRLSDEELKATMYMINRFDELNKLVKDQQRYRQGYQDL